jgi:probable O-glycosylation ligase (exosortase A-associated)
LALAISATATNKVRIHAIIWVVVVSLFYYGAKGGIFTLMSGGGNIVLGPMKSIIRDNNHLALALLMVLPLANYVRMDTKKWWLSVGILAAMGLCVVSILGSYSRGAYLAMAVLAVVAWWRSKNKLLYPIIAAVVIGGGSLSGGEGSILGSMIGALIMAFLRNGCQQVGWPNYIQEIIIGAIIVIAVAVDRWRSNRAVALA